MNRWIRLVTSSLGKKFVMGITGLLLCLFLVVHLGGNLLLYVGPEAYNHYAHALHSQEWFVKIAEAGLVLLFGLHIVLAFWTTRENRSARKTRYEVKESKLQDRLLLGWIRPETWMFISGAIVLGFLILHLSDFALGLRLRVPYEEEPFDRAVRVLNNSLSFWVYFVGCVILGAHLGHGAASAFQSLGVNHPRYNGLIHWTGIVFAVAIAAGFASLPWWALFAAASPTGQ